MALQQQRPIQVCVSADHTQLAKGPSINKRIKVMTLLALEAKGGTVLTAHTTKAVGILSHLTKMAKVAKLARVAKVAKVARMTKVARVAKVTKAVKVLNMNGEH